MSQSRSEQKEEIALNELRPKKSIVVAKNLSDHKFKDKFFNKEKQYFDQKGQAKTVRADWREFVIGGQHIITFINEPISKIELAAMKSSTGAVDYYLEKIKKAPKTDK